MPKKTKAGRAAKKAASRKPVAKKAVRKKKAAKKKTALRKKTAAKKRAAPKKKKTAVKKAAVKKAVKKASRKRPARKSVTAAAPVILPEPTIVEPGPPPLIVPPVEEPVPNEEAVGTVTHYYSHLGVAVVQLNNGELRTGDTVHIQGHTTDLTQTVESMEYEHQHVDRAEAGQSVGIKVADHVREHDILYRVRS